MIIERDKSSWIWITIVFAFTLAFVSRVNSEEQHFSPKREQARQILDAAGIKGGLIVHIDCDDGRLTAALHADNRYLVHGLDANWGGNSSP